MKLSRKNLFVFFCWLIVAAHAAALVAILFAAATARAHAALPTPSARTGRSEPCESPARPGCNPAPTVSFRSLPSALWPLTSSPSALRAANPAIAGSRLSSGPGSLSVFYPVKQSGARKALTLPAVAG